MSAYLLEIRKRCEYSVCQRQATHAVFNTLNESCGRFCLKHAKVRLHSLLRAEPHCSRRAVGPRRRDRHL